MTANLRDSLPGALREVRTKPLFVMRLDVHPLQIIGAAPGAYRRVGAVPSGIFDGEASNREDLFQLIGVHVARAQQDSPWFAFRSRFPWLGCNMAAGILAAFLSGVFEKELSQVVALAFFAPSMIPKVRFQPFWWRWWQVFRPTYGARFRSHGRGNCSVERSLRRTTYPQPGRTTRKLQ